MMENKVLLITYYWPPAGGAGVQRWAKLQKYLSRQGYKVYVVTVHQTYATVPYEDSSYLKDIHENTEIHSTKAFNPIKIYESLSGKKTKQHGFENTDSLSLKSRILRFVRSNFFLPDPRVGWNKHAIRKCKELIQQENIFNVITTSPPHSTHLIGLKLKKGLKSINWIADFRDPWTDMYTFEALGLTKWTKRIHKRMEKQVIENADHVFAATRGFRDFLKTKTTQKDNKFTVLPNGFDPEDYTTEPKEPNEKVRILYTGKITSLFDPSPFFKSLDLVLSRLPKSTRAELVFYGNVGETLKTQIQNEPNLKNAVRYHGFVEHSQIPKIQQGADLLLLVIPTDSPAIQTSKLFEYLATGNSIICLGKGEAGQIVEELNAGKSFDRNQITEMTQFIEDIVLKRYKPKINKEKLRIYNREYQASQIVNLLTNEQLSQSSS